MLTIASFFAGVGGIDLGFQQTGRCRTVYANEFDSYPAATFQENFPIKVDLRDINKVKSADVPITDIIVGGFPCQAFSIAGLRQGFQDKKGRGELFFQLARIVNANRPEAALFENVKNLVSHDDGRTFRIICEELQNMGYHIEYKVLNAMKYGNVAQNRERIYIVAFKNEAARQVFQWPEEIPLTNTVRDIIDFEGNVPDRYYYTEGRFAGDIYEQLKEAMEDDDIENPAIYQWRRKYVRKNQSGVIPTLTANQGGGGHNVCLIKTRHGIRKMTPRECFTAQGFDRDNFVLPEQSDTRLYKEAGNSVCVPVIRRIAEAMLQALDNTGYVALEDRPR